MSDYLSKEYDVNKRPLTTYPEKLAQYLFNKFEMRVSDSILEIGAGRCELLSGFKKLGLDCYAIDSAPSAKIWADEADINFQLLNYNSETSFNPFNRKFNFIISKSFIEHISTPVEYGIQCLEVLEENGSNIILTPDFETNYRIFFDDITHIKPFTTPSLTQLFELSGYVDVDVFRFRQLPSTWNSSTMNSLAWITSLFSHHRSKKKWFRWSRELMIIGSGKKPK